MKPVPAESIEFLRDCGMPEDGLDILRYGRTATITADTLMIYLRAAYVAGRQSVSDPYVWRSVDEMVNAAETADAFQH